MRALQQQLTWLSAISLIVALMLFSGVARCDSVFQSAARATPLIELFTSEGCNSCPPADAWIRSLGDASGLWSQFVPVVFHVTYWDGLGWRDRFAQQQFDALQARTASRAGTGVYTPGVFVAGDEWRSWRRAPHAYEQLPVKTVGVLTLRIRQSHADVSFDSTNDMTRPRVALAWLQSDQTTQVRRGENAGKTLHHAFVVRKLDWIELSRSAKSGDTWRAAFDVSGSDRARNQAVAVWVVDANDQPIQATGGWLSRTSTPSALSR